MVTIWHALQSVASASVNFADPESHINAVLLTFPDLLTQSSHGNAHEVLDAIMQGG